ncbi:MAG: oligosaccharide flippase family protein [Bacteroidales bacterium]|nr:oligosaccharide flippase family protein [Bacteroidales bacterium]MDD3989934.1 oligosaccharide flippase family protein [Bacteroidales bacterium]
MEKSAGSANPFRKLAKETVIYGLSTILARLINFLFLPLYTYTLTTSSLGVAAYFLAYIAVFQVILTMGLETGCFRFASKDNNPDEVFSNALITVGSISLLFFGILSLFSGSISSALGYPGHSKIIVYVGVILASDCFTSILFAKLRYEHRALKFAVIKTIKIISETLFNIVLFFGAPLLLANNPGSLLGRFISPQPDFTYIIFAIFMSCIVLIILFIPEIAKIKIRFNRSLWRKMMLYSLPLMITQLPGIINDFADRLLFEHLTPAGRDWKSDLGIFFAVAKLATFMMLFIQMFRYAAEPFFFSREKEQQNSKREEYAKVTEHFTAFCMLIFLGIMLFIDVIEIVVGPDFRAGIGVVPVMLMAYLLLGLNFNISMWYKLSGKTNYGIVITLSGLTVTLAVNLLFMPRYSYHAAAWGHLASYLAMLLLSLWLGNRFYPIPYRWTRILSFIGAGLALFFLSKAIPPVGVIMKYAIHSLLILIYIAIYFKIEKIPLWKSKS